MAKEQEQKAKLSYEELEQVAINLKRQLDEVNRANEIRDMAYFCLSLLDHKDSLKPETVEKVVVFLDRLVPTAREQEGAAEKE